MCLFFFVGEFPFLYFDVIFVSQPLQCLVVRKLFVLHDEVYHISSLTATETFA